MKIKKLFTWTAFVLGGALVAGQAVRPSRANPVFDPTKTLMAVAPPPPAVAASLDRACNDCHSSATVWPWYTNISPLSWWIAHHVNEGRKEVNFSDWGTFDARGKAKRLGDICEQMEKREMPMESYTFIHREAQLSDDERKAICDWTKAARAELGPLPQGGRGFRGGRGEGEGRGNREGRGDGERRRDREGRGDGEGRGREGRN